MTTDQINLVLTVFGILCTMMIALLGAIWGELRSMRKEISAIKENYGNRIVALENTLTWLPCIREGKCGGDR